MSQEWAYDNMPFKMGQPELVATDPAYRRKGLMQRQFEVIHALSAARGEMVQGITGISWFYRQFGYEMALDLGGARRLYWGSVGKLGKDEQEIFKIRQATESDIPLLAKLYEIQCATSLLKCLRNEKAWKYALNLSQPETIGYKQYYLIETLVGEPVGYVEYIPFTSSKRFLCNEFAVLPGYSLRMVVEFFLRHVKAQAEELNKGQTVSYSDISFGFGEAHPLYEVLGQQLERQINAYTWYIRVPDLPGFIRHISPVLERRLRNSHMEGYSGSLRLNFYRSHLALTFNKGQLTEVGTFVPDKLNGGDARFPYLTFLHLLFGHRTLDELNHIYPDCYASNERIKLLVGILFPKQASQVIFLN
jgi:hypothetical protein